MNQQCTEHIDILVEESESLWRRIVQVWIHRAVDGSVRPSSAAFKWVNVSVDIASKTTPQESIRQAAALAGFAASIPVALGYPVVEDPIEGNAAHAFIKGKITSSAAKKIALASTWVIPPRETVEVN